MKEYVNTGNFNISGALNIDRLYDWEESVSTGNFTLTADFTGRYAYGDPIKTDSFSLTVTLQVVIFYERLTDDITTGNFTLTAEFN